MIFCPCQSLILWEPTLGKTRLLENRCRLPSDKAKAWKNSHFFRCVFFRTRPPNHWGQWYGETKFYFLALLRWGTPKDPKKNRFRPGRFGIFPTEPPSHYLWRKYFPKKLWFWNPIFNLIITMDSTEQPLSVLPPSAVLKSPCQYYQFLFNSSESLALPNRNSDFCFGSTFPCWPDCCSGKQASTQSSAGVFYSSDQNKKHLWQQVR